ASALHREVSARLAERLGVVRITPRAILDAGCGPGEALGELGARYPDARLFGVDLAYRMTIAARARAAVRSEDAVSLLAPVSASRRQRAVHSPHLICGDIQSLPLRAGSIDMVWSNLVLHWVNDPMVAFAEFYRVLGVGGLLTFTTLGPDTLRELRSAFASV